MTNDTSANTATSRSRVPFAQGKDVTLMHYKRTLGAFQEEYDKYLQEYGVPFDHKDDCIPEVFKFYFQLVGMRQVIQDQTAIDAIHEEIAEANDYHMWEC